MLKDKKERPKYIYDEYIKILNLNLQLSSQIKKDLKLFIKNSTHFFICIGMMDGKLRNYISNLFIKEKLKQISIKSKNALIDNTSSYGGGTLFMPNVVVI